MNLNIFQYVQYIINDNFQCEVAAKFANLKITAQKHVTEYHITNIHIKQISLQYVCKRVCADWLPQTCGRTEAEANKITRGNTNEYNLLKQLQHNSLLTKYIRSLKQFL